MGCLDLHTCQHGLLWCEHFWSHKWTISIRTFFNSPFWNYTKLVGKVEEIQNSLESFPILLSVLHYILLYFMWAKYWALKGCFLCRLLPLLFVCSYNREPRRRWLWACRPDYSTRPCTVSPAWRISPLSLMFPGILRLECYYRLGVQGPD